ncbi:hypothetical protein K438DRAFT_1937669 [Mycena galopus ATCC 62051]|nr:hypothetical protein K438DRAFT_1937669 [Mycena galopus ATCC 62051]
MRVRFHQETWNRKCTQVTRKSAPRSSIFLRCFHPAYANGASATSGSSRLTPGCYFICAQTPYSFPALGDQKILHFDTHTLTLRADIGATMRQAFVEHKDVADGPQQNSTPEELVDDRANSPLASSLQGSSASTGDPGAWQREEEGSMGAHNWCPLHAIQGLRTI